MRFDFELVDVFGSDPWTGNPLAVVTGTKELDAEEMLQIARWLNLSETVFLLPPTLPGADYRVRIFTLSHELPFAGHPTLGSCHSWLDAGGRPQIDNMVVQQCGAGLVQIAREGEGLAFAAPPLLRSGMPASDEIEEACILMGIDRTTVVDAQWVDNGPGWIALMLSSAEAVLAVEPARHHDRHVAIGLIGPHSPGSETAFEVRAIFSGSHGELIEDPATGSLNASLGQWLFASGRVSAPYTAAQGTRLGRRARIRVSRDDAAQVWIGGQTATRVRGKAEI